jgi:hypothetical protein
MTPEASLEGSRMSHESLTLEEVLRRARRMVRNFKPEDVDKVPMRPTQGFEPLVRASSASRVHEKCSDFFLSVARVLNTCH